MRCFEKPRELKEAVAPFESRLYVIVDPLDLEARPSELAARALDAGARTIQLRWKTAPTAALLAEAERIAMLARRAAAKFIVNDRADVALAVGADGVHLGQRDLPAEAARSILGPDHLIGLSTHNPAEIEKANHAPVDYLAFGPIFPTKSKEKADPVQGIAGLERVRALTDKPIVAIGGIGESNLAAVIEAGADAVALIAEIIRAKDIGAKIRSLLAALGEQR